MFQADVDAGLCMIPDSSYDYAILSETLQVVHRPRFVLSEMLRVARVGIVSFPNYGQWSHRLNLGWTGRMPKGGALAFDWYNTPDIHLFSLKDFFDLCKHDEIQVLDVACLSKGKISKILTGLGLCNLGADHVLVMVTRGR